MKEEVLLEVKDLTVSIGKRHVINDVSFSLRKGRILSLVGESGSGKTLTSLAVLDLLPETAVRQGGEVLYRGSDIYRMQKEKVRQLRGNDIAMVFQEPFTALNPVLTVGDQIRETILAHRKRPKAGGNVLVKELMEMVRLSPEVETHYPHELSGGMRQRIVLAMALSCDPDVLMLDEPTTALDVSVQKEILDLVRDIQKKRDLAILFITHDFSIVNTISDEVCVMKQGEIVERGPKENILGDAQHPYTKKLIECIPRLGDKRSRLPV
ncbi:MAG: ATP-binding cassette domain-containing protein [Candidatus Omnitrophica bacterium]|nr:ATP-binding cassette domain-containing protein [Candidatus Omnitrophota bacterium]